MLDKDLYDSWKSRMELYMQNKDNGRMILESVKHGLLIWPKIEENRVTMIKKYAELSATEKIQADCDLKATNIILQEIRCDDHGRENGGMGEVNPTYAYYNGSRTSKDNEDPSWSTSFKTKRTQKTSSALEERIQLLMQGTLLTKQERECNLYDAFDKFAHIKEESLHQYYFRFTQLINDINIYKMKLEQFQVNTKFLNSLPTEWIHQDAYPQPQSVPQIEYNVSIVNQQTHLAEFPQIDSGLAVPVFNASYSACKYFKLIQELLGYVRDTCPDIPKPSKKLVSVMPINKKKTVTFVEPIISSSTSQKQLGSSQTKTKQTTYKSVSTSTRVIRSTKSKGSKSIDNIKNDRILQISSSTLKKNKVEDHFRIVKSCLNKPNYVVEPSGNAHVPQSKLNTNYELICVKCNSSMFDARHKLYFLELVSDMNPSSKSKSIKKAKKKEECKPTRKVFT
ncbi:hypothetical protein Tco_0580692 [Tanacetum coccineum]